MINTPELRNEEQRIRQGMTRKEMSEANRIVENNTLPASDDYERLLLASVIQYPELHLKRCAVKKEYFYNPVMGKIFGKICEMYKAGIGINVTTVLHEIKNEDAEIILYGLQETDTTKCDIRFKTYEKGIIDAWKRRQTIQNLLEVVERTYKSNDLSAIQNEIDTVSDVLKIGSGKINPDDLTNNWLIEPAKFEFVIPGLLAKGLVGWLYGSGGSYKSLAALWLVLQRSIAKIDGSQMWLNRFEVTSGKSLYFSAEDTYIDFQHRIYAIVQAMHENRPDIPLESFNQAINDNCRIIPREVWLQDGKQFLVDQSGTTGKENTIIDTINAFKADLVIFDTYSRIAAIEENDNQQAAQFISVMEKIRDETGASILIVDHSSKFNRQNKNDPTDQNSLRGAGSKMDNARFGLSFKRKSNDVLEIVNSKSFRCKATDPFKVKMQYPVFKMVEDEEPEPDVFDLVINLIKDNPGIKSRQIRSAAHKKTEVVNQALSDAKDEGLIINEGKGYFYVE